MTFIFLAFSLGFQNVRNQPVRFKTSSASFTDKDSKGKWNDWSEFVDANILSTLDAKKNLITINSNEVRSLSLIHI